MPRGNVRVTFTVLYKELIFPLHERRTGKMMERSKADLMCEDFQKLVIQNHALRIKIQTFLKESTFWKQILTNPKTNNLKTVSFKTNASQSLY